MHHDLQIGPLKTLVAIVELGSFRKAAEVLHITQPAVSQQMRRLASVLNEPIFATTGRRMQLSPAGEELLGYARRIVSLNDEAISRFRSRGRDNNLTIGVSDQLADSLPAILRTLAEQDPGIRTTVRTGPSESLENQVTVGGLDMALLLNPPKVIAYQMHHLGHIQLSWFGRPAPREDSLIPLSLFTEPSRLRRHTLDVLEGSGVPWWIGYEGSDLNGLRAATQAGLGVACLIANADELWELPTTLSSALLPHPEPIPIGMALSPGLGPKLVQMVTTAAQTALRVYPLN